MERKNVWNRKENVIFKFDDFSRFAKRKLQMFATFVATCAETWPMLSECQRFFRVRHGRREIWKDQDRWAEEWTTENAPKRTPKKKCFQIVPHKMNMARKCFFSFLVHSAPRTFFFGATCLKENAQFVFPFSSFFRRDILKRERAQIIQKMAKCLMLTKL